MVIKELIFDENDATCGISAISYVTNPAVKGDFFKFAGEGIKRIKDTDITKEMFDTEGKYSSSLRIPLWYKYTADPSSEIVGNSHKFCIEHAGKYLHISQIRNFGKFSDQKAYDYGFVYDPQSNQQIGKEYFANFMTQPAGQNYSVLNAIFQCRHRLSAVRSQQEYLTNIKGKVSFNEDIMFSADDEKISIDIKFAVTDAEKREVVGDVLIAEQLIYRQHIPGLDTDGYVWISKETIKKLYKKFGFSNQITLQHKENITGQAIMMNTWLEDDGMKWKAHYKIVSDKLWEQVKNEIGGFSVEMKLHISA